MRKENLKKRLWSLAFIWVLLLGMLAPAASASGEGKIHYVALGDSLATGVTSDKQLGEGYADLTAAYFKEQNRLGSFSKEFAVPGYKTENVLDDLKKKETLKEAVKKANFITISVGANDILQTAIMDKETKTLILDPNTVPSLLQKVAVNYTDMIHTIQTINPHAQIYVMGYYFPFPNISDVQKPQLIQLTHQLNLTIQGAVVKQGAAFVPVYEKFGDDSKEWVPNPEDIHPNVEGYKLMSEALLEVVMTPVAADLPAGHWAEKEIKLLLSQKLMKLDEKGNIYPEKKMTRAEVAQILFSSIPMTKSIPANPGFKDVPENHPAYMAIAKLAEAGVFAKAEQFKPNASITRAELAKVVTLAFQLKSGETVPVFKDLPKSHWANRYIQAVTANKIMTGYGNGTFGINDSTTRAQFAVILVRSSQTIK